MKKQKTSIKESEKNLCRQIWSNWNLPEICFSGKKQTNSLQPVVHLCLEM